MPTSSTNDHDDRRAVLGRRIRAAVRIVVSAALLVFVLSRLPVRDARDTLAGINVPPLIVAAAVIVVGQVARAARTVAFLRPHMAPGDVAAMLRMQMLAFLPGMVSPAKAGELLKVELLRREWGVSVARGAGAFLAERAADVAMLGACATWGLVVVFGRTIPLLAYAGAAGFAMGGLAGWWLWRSDRFPGHLRARLAPVLRDIRWPTVLLTTVTYWLLVFGIVWLFAQAVGAPASFRALAGAVPLSLLTALMPISFGGFGVREGAMLVLFQHPAVGCTQAQAVGIGLLYDLIGLGVPALMGVGYTLRGRRA